ncbi:MAG TPA: PepSY-associated TM helix domain-containing protein [Sphingomonas sp.]|nr:PepSY-associated TM helix domain-containing protein [Sphingomonas sp.]
MTKVQLRALWFQVHKWIGLLLAIILIPLSLTGSLLVWDGPLDRLLRPAHHVDAGPIALPPSAYVAAARGALPSGSRITSLVIGEGPVMVTAMPPQAGQIPGPPQRIAAWIDPATGRVIDSGPTTSPLLRWSHVFHGSLQIPGSGRAVVGWLGVAMLISSLTGIWLWWPLTGSVTRGFRWKRQPTINANLHHLAGFWISLPLAILSLTGVIIAWPQMMGSGGMRRPMAIPLASPHLTIDQVLAAPAKSPATISWPTDKDGAWTVSGGSAGSVKVADDSGMVAPADPAASRDRPRPFYRRLHDGGNMGLVWQIVIFLGGIAPALLGVTGIIMWLRTRTWRGDVARRQAATHPGSMPFKDR